MLLSLVNAPFSPNCSRPPGFKSSLNRVQLKIHQVLEATSSLLTPVKLAFLAQIASSFFRNLVDTTFRFISGSTHARAWCKGRFISLGMLAVVCQCSPRLKSVGYFHDHVSLLKRLDVETSIQRQAVNIYGSIA